MVRLQPSDRSSPQQPGTPQPLRQRVLWLAHPVAFPWVDPPGLAFEVDEVTGGDAQETHEVTHRRFDGGLPD